MPTRKAKSVRSSTKKELKSAEIHHSLYPASPEIRDFLQFVQLTGLRKTAYSILSQHLSKR